MPRRTWQEKLGIRKLSKRERVQVRQDIWDSERKKIVGKLCVDYNSLSGDSISGGICPRKDISDYLWKKGMEESKETIMEIERKSKSVAPLYSKGGYQYITPGSDPTTIGKKI